MANAVKNIAKFIKKESENDEAKVLWELCKALEGESSFDLQKLFDLSVKSFDLALKLLDEWRIDRHISERRIQKYLDLSDD
ncbi:MAG: hypothetical protein HXY27_02075 [Hydrogenophilaceae bacterium]|jgi:hypothetical protein|nr:hypothetical protein [Hydrogenophilaceae bacterium]